MSAPKYKYINKLQGKRVLVFGGTSGIGFAIVEACIEYGAIVAITGSNQAKLEKTVERLTTAYPDVPKSNIIIHACDLADVENKAANMEALFDAVTDNGKTKLNHIAFTAGDKLKIAPISEWTSDQWVTRNTVRVLSLLEVAKILPKYMETSPDSSFTMTTGVNITKPMKGWSTGILGGGSVEALARGFAVDLAPVRCNVVSPGAIDTELLAPYPDAIKQKFAEATTVQRLGRPEDVAEAYLYCMKDGFTTGGIIASNGGRLLVDVSLT